MFRLYVAAALVATSCSYAKAGSSPDHSQALDDMIARHAEAHGIPEHLVHRVVMRESRYNPRLVHRAFYGLMQITYPTARSMGYTGKPAGLLDPDTNLTYAVPYLANAYKIAEGNETRAVALYSGGYYYVAKRRKMLGTLRTAGSESLAPDPVAVAPEPRAEPPANPIASLFHLLAEHQADSGSAPAQPK